MSLFEKGSVYEQPSIYNQGGGGGGGGEPTPDPSLYTLYSCLKATTSDAPDLSGTNMTISDTDKIVSFVYFDDGYLELYTTNKRICGIQKIGPITLRLYGWGSNEYIDAGNVPGYFAIESVQNKYNINGVSKTVGSILTGLGSLQQIFRAPANSVFFYLSVFDEDDNEKYKFVPCLRIQDNRKGLLELYTNSFLPCPNTWELVGPTSQL